MKYLILKICLMTSLFCLSQTEQISFNEVASEFQSKYNDSNYEAIHNMLDDVMKRLIPKGEITDFLNTVRSNFGTIKNNPILNYER